MMDANISRTLRLRVEKAAENLRKNGFEVQILEHATDVVPVFARNYPRRRCRRSWRLDVSG